MAIISEAKFQVSHKVVIQIVQYGQKLHSLNKL